MFINTNFTSPPLEGLGEANYKQMKQQVKLSESRKKYLVDILALFPFLILLFTGIVMLIYHTGKTYSETTFGINGNLWLNIHIVFAVISFVMITLHLSLHLNWFKKLFSGKLKNKYWIRNLILVFLFLFAILTSFIPLLFLSESNTATTMLGIHNKLGLLMIIFFVIHILSYFKWLVNMSKTAFKKS
jgi:magnesium-transporting ATPase (P-type)